jgi:hypothetical protein
MMISSITIIIVPINFYFRRLTNIQYVIIIKCIILIIKETDNQSSSSAKRKDTEFLVSPFL